MTTSNPRSTRPLPAWAWSLPFASATLLLLVALRPIRPDVAPAAGSVVPRPAGSVRSWSGGADLQGGAWSARLSPLQLDAERQAFDARALWRRLGLGEEQRGGQAWRLELSLDAAAAASLELPELRLADAAGDGPALLDFGPERSALQALFQAPAEPLEPDGSVQLLLWGPVPEGALRLSFGEASAAELFAAAVDADELPTSLAGRRGETTRAVR